MAQKSRFHEGIRTLGFMMALTAVCVSGVAFAYQITKNRIELNQSARLKRAVLAAAGIETDLPLEELNAFYLKNVKEVKGSDSRVLYYQVTDQALVFPREGIGLWGKIAAVVGFKSDLKTLTGISFTAQNETPGLGGRIEEPWFKKQFDGKKGPLSMVPEGEPSNDNQFDAITGATITSNSVKNMLNEAFKDTMNIVEKAKSKK